MAQEDERSLQRHGDEPVSEETGIEVIPDPEIDRLIKLLSQSTQALSTEEYVDSIAKRQETVSKYLLRGGPDTLRRFFERIRQMEIRQSVKLDLSMIDISGKILGGLYLPSANLQKLTFTESDLTGSFLIAADASEAVGAGSILRGVVAVGMKFDNAVMPDVDWSGGRFVGCSFVNTVMTGGKIDQETNFAGCRFIGTYISGTDLSPANRMGAIFRGLRR